MLSDDVINEVVNRVKRVANPQKIILFGSYARGRATSESDLDLLVISESELPRYKRAAPIYQALSDMLYPMDILVYSSSEVHEWSQVPQAFVTTAMREGKVLYEKKHDLVQLWLRKAESDLARTIHTFL